MSLRPTFTALQRIVRSVRNPRVFEQVNRQISTGGLIPGGGSLRSGGIPLRALTTAVTPETGFSYPGPRKLSEIVKIQLLNKHTSERVKEIWDSYHRDHKTAIGHTLSSEEYSLLKGRSERCRHFVLPVPRESGYFTLIVQFQGKQCFMTYLEHYKANAAGAQPWLTLTLFDEMLETKGLALLRAEVTNMITRREARVLVELLKSFYLGQGKTYDAVVAFNEASDKFEFNTVLRAAGIGS